MNYSAVQSAYFLTRDNRFIASCRLKETNEIVTVHVKIQEEAKNSYFLML